jgi:hypothetical protein
MEIRGARRDLARSGEDRCTSAASKIAGTDTSISLLPFTWVSRNGWTCGVRRARNPEKHLLFARDREFDSTSLQERVERTAIACPQPIARSGSPVSAFRWCREDRSADRARSAPALVQPPRRHTRREPTRRRAPPSASARALVPSAPPDPVSLCRANRLDWAAICAGATWDHPGYCHGNPVGS